MEKVYTYLALGDSYTIGEGVLIQHSFPYQVVQILRKKGYSFAAPEVIAKTGWTTDELSTGMAHYNFLPQYNFVTLLIGVNNQYRGRSVEEYKEEFEGLLKQGLQLANGKKDHVMVLSIPDYSVTPFAASLDVDRIAKEIELYNSVNKAVSVQYKVHHIDITPGTRKAKEEESLLTADKLHPSEIEYRNWAEKVTETILSQLK